MVQNIDINIVQWPQMLVVDCGSMLFVSGTQHSSIVLCRGSSRPHYSPLSSEVHIVGYFAGLGELAGG